MVGRRRLPLPHPFSVVRVVIVFLAAFAPTVRCWASKPFPITRKSRGRLSPNMVTSQAAFREMELWLDAGDDASIVPPSRLDFVDAMILGEDDVQKWPTSTKRYAIKTDRNDERNPHKLFCQGNDKPIGAIVDVSTPSGQDTALAMIGSVEWIVITCEEDREDGWIMIPAENLISSCQNTGTKIAAYVDRVGDVGGLARALELGIDALCIDAAGAAQNGDLWDALIDAKEERRSAAAANANDGGGGTDDDPTGPGGPAVVQGTCRRVAPAGGKSTVLADRVCVDLVQSLKPTEGCWIGSSSKITALVLSEAARSSFVPSRPFRVNAGPVHSYVVMGDGTSTKYLAELGAGDEVLVYDAASGGERPVAVGRLKVEVRPCVQVGLFAPRSPSQTEEEASRGQVFLQQAETVRLGQTLGSDSFLRITDLEYKEDAQASDVLLRVADLGTHVGKAYSGKVTER